MRARSAKPKVLFLNYQFPNLLVSISYLYKRRDFSKKDIIIIQGNGATDGGITIVQGRNKLYKSNGDSFDVNFSKMFITLKQSTSKTQPGALFSITYCADFDKCHEQENYCKNSGTCIRDGFNKYQCSCNAGYSGRHCESDIDECASGLHSCPEDSKCKNSDGGFYCTDKRGAIVHRSSFGKTSNKSVVELCGSNPSSGLRKCEASRC
uniref:EGF-like domain-containing protein n=1 Tax=Ciona intestinalis TaxID=7719 RepID=H2XYL9_CIOIN